ncbi:MAG: hypothetical protein L0210_15590, partial [Rhodospirillales bacterium]|nr:hypothetical protein [Rhodospirillales bacterium]
MAGLTRLVAGPSAGHNPGAEHDAKLTFILVPSQGVGQAMVKNLGYDRYARMCWKLFCLLVAAHLLIQPSPSLAQPTVEDTAAPSFDGLSTLWVLLAAFLVFFMQAGFGMVEVGLIRAKNASNILMKNLMDFCFASLGF